MIVHAVCRFVHTCVIPVVECGSGLSLVVFRDKLHVVLVARLQRSVAIDRMSNKVAAGPHGGGANASTAASVALVVTGGSGDGRMHCQLFQPLSIDSASQEKRWCEHLEVEEPWSTLDKQIGNARELGMWRLSQSSHGSLIERQMAQALIQLVEHVD